MFRILLTVVFLFSLAFAGATAHAQSIPAAYTLTVADVETAAGEALVAKGAGERIQASVLGARAQAFYESSTPVEPRIAGLNFDKATGRWTANLLIMSGENTLTAMPVGGRWQEMVALPVLKRNLKSGEIITQADIDVLDFPLSRTRADSVTDAAQLIGQSPRSAISPRRPVRVSEIASPVVVKKGAVISLRYVSGGVEITTSGQAMNNAGLNEPVEVRNLNSKNVVRAVVEGPNAATIRPATQPKQMAKETLGVTHAIAN